ncbi:hypothetical protein LUZ60_007317 [Juncus effusus]|nr:hypothetical protein LUZ60_007317 [Juncus effusus]
MAQQQERQKEEEKLIGSQIPVRDQLLRLTRFAILLILSIVVMALYLPSGSFTSPILHQVPDNHVGAYWRGDALMESFTHPGIHLKLPSTRFRPIRVILKIDAVRDVPCITQDGVELRFEKIEVVSRLPKEDVYEVLLEHGPDYYNTLMLARVHHKVKEICSVHPFKDLYLNRRDIVGEEMECDLKAHCSRHAPGLQVRAVRVYQTITPDLIKRAYNRLEEKRTKAVITAKMQKPDGFQAKVRMYVEAEGGANCTEKARMYREAEGDDNCRHLGLKKSRSMKTSSC